MKQGSLKGRRTGIAITTAVTAIAALILAALAWGDNVQNDVVAGGNDTFTSGGSTTVNYLIHKTGSTCDAADGSAATLNISAPAGVTATPTSRTYTTCETNQSVVFSSTKPGNYSITVTVSDTSPGDGYNTSGATFTLHVLNRAPTCTNDSGSTDEDTALTGRSVAPDCSDPDTGETLTYQVTQQPAHGTLTSFSTSTGAFTYTPASNYNGPDSFKFKANDGHSTLNPPGSNLSNEATFSLTVNAVNDAPVCSAGSNNVDEDNPLTDAVSCSDVDGDTLTYSVTDGPSHGSLNGTFDSSTGGFTYTPASNYNGPDSIKFKANDGHVDSNEGTFSLTVNPVNDAPVCTAGSTSTNEDTAKAASVSCSDVDGNTLSYSVTQDPSHGSLNGTFSSSTGGFTYTPASNYNGPDSFKFTANDGSTDSNEATFSITVNAVNDAPVCAADSNSVNEDNPLSDSVGCTDVEGDTLTYSVTQGPAHGSLNGTFNSSTGAFTYTPNPNFNGSDSFKFKANDATADSSEATFSITVNPVNDAPVCSADSNSVNEDNSLSDTAGCTDVDGDSLTYTITQGLSHGSFNGTLDTSTGGFTYTPASNYNGPDSFKFKANDGHADSGEATFSITVNAVNDAPAGNGDSYSTDEETTLNVPAPGVLGNDTDVEGSALTAALVSGPSHGSLTLNANGSFSYTPDTDYAGPDSFTYRASDGSANSSATTVNLTVNNVNDAPDCAADSDNVDEDTTLTGSVSCTDADGDALTYSVPAGQGPAHAASFSLNADGSFSYTPTADYNGPDSFQFQASDGTASSSAATFTITVNPVDETPTGGGTTGGTTTGATGGTAGVTATKTKCKKPKKSSASAAKKKRCKKKKKS